MRVLLVLSSTCAALAGQAALITEQRVRETVTWLAADERAGRDTGSPEIEQAALWLAQRFEAAGLARVHDEGSWFHEFTVPGLAIDSGTVQMKLARKMGKEVSEHVLEPDRDVRLWTGADVIEGRDEACTVATSDDPVMQRLLGAESARRPMLIEVAEDHPYWQRAKGEHCVVSGRRAAARPVFLVRRSVLPAPPDPDENREITWVATWSVGAARKTDVPQKNVMALLPGTTAKDEYVVVSAHYDHIGTGNPVDGDAIFNGADDNATGTTAVVLLAEALAKTPMRRSVLFVCFAAEERRLLGSAAFCAKPPVPLEQIVCNLNIEMIGRPEPGKEGKAWITGQDLSDFAAIAKQALGRRSVGLVDFPMAAQLFSASDNFSFARQGIVAHSVSAGSLHDDYHKPGDEVDKLDIAHMTRIVTALLEVVRELADREAAPAWNEAGRKRIERLRK